MGEDAAFESVSGSRYRKTKLNSVLKKARAAILPQASVKQFRRRFYFFMAYGCTPADQRQEKFQHPYRRLYRRRGDKGHWTSELTQKLKRLVDDHPDLYLDEIQDRFCAITRTYWLASHLWKRLYGSVEYSVMVTVDKAKQRDEQE